MKRILLASSSPRRKEILSKIDVPFVIEHSAYEEDMTLDMQPAELAMHLAAGKADAVVRAHPDDLVIAADTIVVFDGKALGKPRDRNDALRMLTALSGKENDIVTGVVIRDQRDGKRVAFIETTKVFMKTLSPQDIEAYVEHGEPLDKAGAYALQGLGSIFIDRIEGDFFNAMGLPLARLAEELRSLGVQILQK